MGNNVYNSLRLLNTYDKKIVNLNADFFNEKSKPIFRNEIIIQNRCAAYEERANAQTAHLVFADTNANAEKTKRAVLCQRSTENDKKEIKICLK